ncbi:porin family protein [Pseudomonadota bacterium]
MKKYTLALVLATTALPSFAESNFSGELLFGTADQKTEISSLSSSSSGDDTSIGIRGAYQFNERIAIELAFHNYGETDDTYIDSFGDTINDKIETTSINIGVKGVLPLENGFSLAGRLGVAMWDYTLNETDSSLPGFVINSEDDGTDIYYGIGAQYDFNEKVFVGMEYTITEMDVSLFGIVAADHEVKNFSLSVGSKF